MISHPFLSKAISSSAAETKSPFYRGESILEVKYFIYKHSHELIYYKTNNACIFLFRYSVKESLIETFLEGVFR